MHPSDKKILVATLIAMALGVCWISTTVVFTIRDGLIGLFATTAFFSAAVVLIGIVLYRPFWGENDEEL